MNDLLKLAGPIIGVIAAGIGLVVTVDQLTARTRLRKTETWAREALVGENNDHRKAYLTDLHLKSVAGVVGTIEVPVRYYFDALLTPAATGWVVISTLGVGARPSAQSIITMVLFSLVLTLAGFRRCVRLYLERRRVVNDYVAADHAMQGPKRDLLELMEGGTRREFVAAFGYSAAVTFAFCGASAYVQGGDDWGFLLLALGAVTTLVPSKVVHHWGKSVRSSPLPATERAADGGAGGGAGA